ncbi:ComEC/Rec2 family competence protein [uncultured Jatrophihabitans sp.]|uniref:ComEC/Rec2 family competence protein n=1 Tax=uncultured Jatrophihabitans sp. TaxID=1610747 RepID=UPI0035CC9AEF
MTAALAHARPGVDREPLDARLAVGAALAWLAVLGCSSLSAVATTWLGAGCGVVGFVVVCGARRRRAAAALGLALFCTALTLLPLAARVALADASPLHLLARRGVPVELEAQLTADPRTLATKGPAGMTRVLVETEARRVQTDGRSAGVDGQVIVMGDVTGWANLLPGQVVRVSGQLAEDADGNPLSSTLFARGPPRPIGRPPWWQRTAGVIRAGLRSSARGLPDQERGLLPGLVDGDTTGLDPVLAQQFKLAGLTHLVAVSGTNCSIVIGTLLLVLRRVRARPWVCVLVGAAALMMFVVVARPSPSVLRAAFMSAIALGAMLTGRPRAALPGLAGVTLALLVWDPTLASSASFAMSVLATLALIVVAPGWARALRKRRVPIGLAEAIAVAAAAHVVTAPVVAAISGRVSLVAIPANVLAEPVVAVTTILGFAAALAAPVWSGLAGVLAWTAGWPCRWLVGVADFFGGLHGATLGWPQGTAGGLLLLALLTVLAVVALRSSIRRVLAAVAVTLLVVVLPVRSATSGWPAAGWVFTACDVGQGDGLVLNAGGGAAVEIDAGPDPVLIDRCLHDLHVDRLALLIFTHYDMDHVGGVAGAARGRPVGQVLTGPLAEPPGGVATVRRVADPRHLVLRTPAVGTTARIGDVTLQVLGPPPVAHCDPTDTNDSSLIVRATVHGISILLTGDAAPPEQAAVLASGADVRADVLKVPHHGSAYFDPAFLAAAHARVAVVSVGLHNDYGHPAPSLVADIAHLGIPLLRTDHDGDIAITANDGRLGAVERGKSASAVGMGERVPSGAATQSGRRPLAAGAVASSAVSARMSSWPRAPSRWTICRTRCPRSSSSSATRNCWSSGRSARSPPRRAPPIRASRSPS